MFSPARFGLLLAFLFTLSQALPLRADQVQLQNGSTIVGSVTHIAADQVTIVTDFAGTLTIAQDKVAGITTDTPQFVKLKSGSTLLGQVQHQGDQTIVQTANGPLNVTNDTIVALWEEGSDSPDMTALRAERVAAEKVLKAAAPKWSLEAAVDVAGKSGNKDRLSVGGSLRAVRKSSKDRLVLYAKGLRAEDNNKTSSEEILGGIEYEYNISPRRNWYVRTEQEYDAVEKLQLRSTLAGGYGYYFIKEEKHSLLGRIGLAFRNEAYEDAENEQDIGADFGLEHDWHFSEWGFLRNKLVYTPSFDDPTGDFRVEHESSVDIALANSKVWSLRLGLSNQYNSMPSGKNVELDSTYFARLVYKWE